MAKKVKEQSIKVYTNADKALYQIAYITGGFTKAQAEELGISLKRLRQHIKQGNVIKDRDYKPRKGQSEYIYNLTRQGKDKCREITNVNNLYKRTGSERHDNALRQSLIADYKEHKIVQYISEKDWAQRLDERIWELRNSHLEEERKEADRIEELRAEGKLSPPDAGYITESGEVVAVEILTKNYGPEERLAKQEFVRVMNISNYKEIDIK